MLPSGCRDSWSLGSWVVYKVFALAVWGDVRWSEAAFGAALGRVGALLAGLGRTWGALGLSDCALGLSLVALG